MNTQQRKSATSTHPGTTTQSTVAAGGKEKNARSVSTEDIRLCAYRKWERAGKPSGDGVKFWLEAEHEMVKE